jgi:16S rRNA G966 N2-methylase RsmD
LKVVKLGLAINAFKKAASLTELKSEKARILENIGLVHLHLQQYALALENAAEVRKIYADPPWNNLILWVAASQVPDGAGSYRKDEIEALRIQSEQDWKKRIRDWDSGLRARVYNSLVTYFPVEFQKYFEELKPK